MMLLPNNVAVSFQYHCFSRKRNKN